MKREYCSQCRRSHFPPVGQQCTYSAFHGNHNDEYCKYSSSKYSSTMYGQETSSTGVGPLQWPRGMEQPLALPVHMPSVEIQPKDLQKKFEGSILQEEECTKDGHTDEKREQLKNKVRERLKKLHLTLLNEPTDEKSNTGRNSRVKEHKKNVWNTWKFQGTMPQERECDDQKDEKGEGLKNKFRERLKKFHLTLLNEPTEEKSNTGRNSRVKEHKKNVWNTWKFQGTMPQERECDDQKDEKKEDLKDKIRERLKKLHLMMPDKSTDEKSNTHKNSRVKEHKKNIWNSSYEQRKSRARSRLKELHLTQFADTDYEEEDEVKQNKAKRRCCRMPKIPWKELWYEYSQNSTLHGMSLTSGPTHLCHRLLWFAIILSSIGWLAYYVTDRVSMYRLYETKIDVDVDYVESMVFPSVTICNQNAFKLTSAVNGAWLDTINAIVKHSEYQYEDRCDGGRFNCSSGTGCVDMAEICDMFPDCPDGSDESMQQCG